MKPRWIVPMTLALVLAVTALPGAAGGSQTRASGWWVVAFDHRITQDDVDALTAVGGRGIQYRPEDSFVVHLGSSAASEASSLEGVSAVRPLTPAEKVDVALGDDADAPRPLTVSVYVAARTSMLAELGQHWDVSPGFPAGLNTAIQDLYVYATPSAARRIAAHEQVLYVGPAMSGLGLLDERGDQIQAGNISGSMVEPGYEAWLQSVGLDGSGVTVSVVDSGVDPHPDLLNRIAAHVDYGPAGTDVPVGEQNDSLGHGTHVAGIVGGDANGTAAAMRIRDSGGHLYGLGAAPGVEIVDQDALSTTASAALCGFVWPPPYPWERLTHDALDNGAAIWNASWWSCEDAEGNYIETSRVFDGLARDADSRAAGSQPFTFVFSAGNNGDEQSVAAPASAKNTISVGATQNARGSLNPNAMAGFSSRGPAADGRILPTISAPGQNIISTRSFAGAVCNVPPTDSFALYSDCSGTSMAAPHVTGAVALITQWWKKSNTEAPSPAMTKALLVNSATDMGTPNIPNDDEGWGRVNLGELFDPGAERVYVDQSVLFTDPGDGAEYTIAPADPAKPMKVTAVWTDAPAQAGAEKALVNDLDLKVTAADGTTYVGNDFADGRSVTGGAPDGVNNVESVYLHGASGTYTVSLSAANLPGDGVPGVGDQTDQDFALVISNAQIVAA
jgi:subtilisin family serine protease